PPAPCQLPPPLHDALPILVVDDPRRSTPGSDDRRRRQIRQHLKSTSRQRRSSVVSWETVSGCGSLGDRSGPRLAAEDDAGRDHGDRKSTRLNSSHVSSSYA